MTFVRTIALSALGVWALSTTAFAQQAPVTIVTFGGYYGEVQRKTLFQPASQRLGIPFKGDTGVRPTAHARRMRVCSKKSTTRRLIRRV